MAEKAVAVLFADSHLAPGAWAGRAIFGDSYFSLSYIFSAAIKLGVPAIGAGDLIDRHENQAGPIVAFQKQLERLRDAGLTLGYLVGQHDRGQVKWLSGHPAAWDADQVSFDLGPFRCCGLDYQPAGVLQKKLDLVPKHTDILFAHQVWGEHMGSITVPQGSMGDVSSARIVVSGDYHFQCKRDTVGKDGQPLALYSPGSTCMQAINEPPDKYFLVLYDSGDLRPFRIPTRAFINWSPLYETEHLDRFIVDVKPVIAKAAAAAGPGLPSELQKPLLRVNYSAALNDSIRRVLPTVADSAFVFLFELPAETASEPGMELLAAETGDARDAARDDAEPGSPVASRRKAAITLDLAVTPYLAAKGLEDLTGDAVRLLQGGDPEDELRRMREESLAEPAEV